MMCLMYWFWRFDFFYHSAAARMGLSRFDCRNACPAVSYQNIDPVGTGGSCYGINFPSSVLHLLATPARVCLQSIGLSRVWLSAAFSYSVLPSFLSCSFFFTPHFAMAYPCSVSSWARRLACWSYLQLSIGTSGYQMFERLRLDE